jgi:hypothetical protein
LALAFTKAGKIEPERCNATVGKQSGDAHSSKRVAPTGKAMGEHRNRARFFPRWHFDRAMQLARFALKS